MDDLFSDDRYVKLRKSNSSQSRDEFHSIAKELISDYPSEPEAWHQYALSLKATGNHTDAYSAYKTCIDLAMASPEPAFYFDFSLYCLEHHTAKEAEKNAQLGIQLCQKLNNSYYLTSLIFMHAESLLRLKRYDEALAECQLLDHDSRWWLNGSIRHKHDIENDCHAGLRE